MAFRHGAIAYSNGHCRCEVCTSGHRERQRELRARRREGLVDGVVVVEGIRHGAATYSNHGCRCEVCRSAWNADRRLYARKARQQRQEAPDGR